MRDMKGKSFATVEEAAYKPRPGDNEVPYKHLLYMPKLRRSDAPLTLDSYERPRTYPSQVPDSLKTNSQLVGERDRYKAKWMECRKSMRMAGKGAERLSYMLRAAKNRIEKQASDIEDLEQQNKTLRAMIGLDRVKP